MTKLSGGVCMKLLILVLEKVEKMEEVLVRLRESGICGATILNSTGMAKTLAASGEEYLFGSLRRFLDLDRKESRTMFVLLKADQIQVAINAIEDVVGDLDQPDTGIVMTVPIDGFKGVQGL